MQKAYRGQRRIHWMEVFAGERAVARYGAGQGLPAETIDAIREHRVSIVHARSRAPAWSAWLACQRTGTHFVTTYHGSYSGRSPAKLLYNSVMARGDVVIAKRHGGLNETITVRRIFQGVGVERVFLLHSPQVASVKVERRGKVRRAKLFYLRDRVGKATRVKQRFDR